MHENEELSTAEEEAARLKKAIINLMPEIRQKVFDRVGDI